MTLDLPGIAARLQEREQAIASGRLGEAELLQLLAESDELFHQLREIRARIAPEWSQAAALLQQLAAARDDQAPHLDIRL